MRIRSIAVVGLIACGCSGKSTHDGPLDDEAAGATGGSSGVGGSTAGGDAAGPGDNVPSAGGVGGGGTSADGDLGLAGEASSTGGSVSFGGAPARGASGGPGLMGFAGRAGGGSVSNVAGAGSGNGSAGVGQVAPSPFPPVEWLPTPWEDVPGKPSPEERFTAVQEGIVGSWHGVVTTPWTDPYEVEAAFTADGHYSASCTYGSNDWCIAFYYGTDDDTELKTYSVDDATLSGKVTGTIHIIFGYDGEYGEAAWLGELSNMDVDATGHRSRFDFNRSDGYGPVHFELERAPVK